MNSDEIVNWIISVGIAVFLTVVFVLFVFLLIEFPWFSVLITVAYLIFMFATLIHDSFL